MIEIRTIAFIEWNHPIEMEVNEIDDESTFIFKRTISSRLRLYRPHLEPFVGPEGIASIVVGKHNTVLPLAVLASQTPKVISLPQPPKALSIRSDGGLWGLHDKELVHYNAMGILIRTLAVNGCTLIGVRGDGVWVIGYKSFDYDGSEIQSQIPVWFVDEEGQLKSPYSWYKHSRFTQLATKEVALFDWDRRQPHRLYCLDPDGTEYLVSLPPLTEQPRGEILGFANERPITLDLVNVNYYDKDGVLAQFFVGNAGLTAAGEAFVSLKMNLDDPYCDLYLENGTMQRIAAPCERPNGSVATLGVLAVEGERKLLGNQSVAAWYSGDRIEESFVVDAQRDRHDVFPYRWDMTTVSFDTKVTSNGTVILSTTGPTGMALIGLRWHL